MRNEETNQEELLREVEKLRSKVAELEELQGDLKESRSRYEAIVGAFDGLIYICSPEYKVEFMNGRFVERTGRNPVGEDCYLALHDLDEICPWCVNERVFAGETIRWEVKSPKDDCWYYVVNTPIPHSDGTVSKMAMIQDVTERKLSEMALRDSEERFRSTFEQAAVGICHVAPDGRFIRVNQKLCDILGYTSADLLSRTFQEITHPDDLEADLSYVKQILQGRIQSYSMEKRYIRNDGSHLWASLTVSPAREPDGSPKYFISVVEDISYRKEAEEAVRESEAQYRSLVEFSPDGVFVQVRERIEFANSAMAKMIGADSPEDLKGVLVLNLVHPDYRKAIQERICTNLEQGKSVPLLEQKLVRVDGSVFDAEAVGAPITYRGRKARQVLVRDISERKRAEDELLRLFAAVENAGETIVVTDSDGSIIYVNPTFEEITGYSRQEALGRSPRILKSGKHDRSFYRRMWETLVSGQVWRGRFTNRRKDGTLFEETATISPIMDTSGQIVNYVAVKRDVTNEVILQKQLLQAQKMEAVGTLAGGIAHDFNNLLQAILGYSDLLLMRKAPGDPERNKLEVIQQAARDGADLVSRILTFSRESDTKAHPVDLNEEVRKAQKLIRRTIPRMIDIELLLAEDLRIIDADPGQLEQVLLNLAVNAHHAMPDGGKLLIETSNVSLTDDYLRSHLGAVPGKYVLLTVSDTGVGMPADVLERIFDPFFTTKTNGEGTGLGLSMVHGIVSQHGGYIRCYSELGRGSSFKIYFPVIARESTHDVAMTREMPAFGMETILLVDDDERVRKMAAQMIERGGYQVITARSGEEALQTYVSRREDIALVILDLIMPGMGGKRCLDELLRMDPNVRVLFASGYSSDGISQEEKRAGARGFICKPYDTIDILGAIRKVLDKGQL
jgi:two-component system cell cycle sensor histidine kinase/response regulator CckA